MSSSSKWWKPTLLAIAGSTSVWVYVSIRNHDERDVSVAEVEASRQWLYRVTPPEPQSSSSSAVQKSLAPLSHLANLQKYGVTVVKETLSPLQVNEWNVKTKETFDNPKSIVWNRGRAHCNISKRSKYYTDMNQVGTRNGGGPKIVGKSTTTKRNWYKRKSNNKEEQNTSQQLSLQEIVELYFKQHSITNYRLTQLQFLNAIPNKSKNQIWHRDNTFPGLTAIVALKDVTFNGPTELLPKSHLDHYTLWLELKNAWEERQKQYRQQKRSDIDACTISIPSCKPLLGCLHAGDTILYDARVLHRGRGYTSNAYKKNSDIHNNGLNNDRPVLVLRWDAVDTPPPGAGLIVTTANGYLGSMLYAAFYGFDKIMSFFA